jgi:hypothetical protein
MIVITPERALLASIFMMLWVLFVFGPVLWPSKK